MLKQQAKAKWLFNLKSFRFSLRRMRPGGFAILAAVAVALGGGAASAQNPQPNGEQSEQVREPAEIPQDQNARPSGEQAANAMLGAWEFSDADHNRVCRLNFRGDAAAGGRRLDVDKNCPNLFPSTKDIVGWALDNYGGLRLLDGRGEAVIELTEVESGMYDGFAPGEGRYVLQTAAAAPVRSAEEMVGDWAIARGTGKPICTLTLANSPAAGGALALRLKTGCDPLVTRFNPNGWRMDQGELVLLSARGQSWQFEENDPNTWQRLPESADPILLLRQ
jgi:Protease inhibitor Inh